MQVFSLENKAHIFRSRLRRSARELDFRILDNYKLKYLATGHSSSSCFHTLHDTGEADQTLLQAGRTFLEINGKIKAYYGFWSKNMVEHDQDIDDSSSESTAEPQVS
jgi:hypothetical protein